MAIADLSIEKADARYDEETKIAYITYRGSLTADESTAVYQWLAELMDTVGLEGVYGEVFDFRKVTEFEPDNLMQARKKSRRYNLRNNGRKVPVAMVVASFIQEETLRGPMQNVEENKRKTIVWKMDEAVQFLHDWHAENSSEPTTEDS
ncbi:MAG: hypothetical protein AAFN11_17300 [Chloroflexota bacterium]